MTDTQWPRFIVFQQMKAGEAHQYAGSVHASDAEMALMNARDVFVRRPACVSLWVVPAKSVFARTAEELGQELAEQTEVDDANQGDRSFSVFQKSTHKGTYIWVGEVNATTPESALKTALETVANRDALVWWVFPAETVTQTSPADIEALFQPAFSKTFRDQAFYHTVAAMQQIRIQSQDNNTDES
jgi:ring-1,2-phenylacetyl-CoA epoxidase subunit PaaB